MRRFSVVLMLTTLALTAACGGSESPEEAASPSASEAPAETPAAEAPAAETPAAEAPSAETPVDEEALPSLLAPESLNERAPDLFRARFRTTQGDFVIEVHRDWTPRGADRFYNLVRNGYYDGVRFFRVLDGFVAQFGINGDPAVNAAWSYSDIQDDPVVESNLRGRVTFAHGGPNTRTTQVFVNLGDNANLDSMGFPPFGEVVEGMDVVDRLYSAYGEGAPRGNGPDQGRLQDEGNAYLEREFERLDYVRQARVEGQ